MKYMNLGNTALAWVATAALLALTASIGQAQLIGVELGQSGDIAYTGTGVFGESFTDVNTPIGYEITYLGSTNPYSGTQQVPAVSLPQGVTLTTSAPTQTPPNNGGYAGAGPGGLVYQSLWNISPGTNGMYPTSNGSIVFSFSGLQDNVVYSIAAYGPYGPAVLSDDLNPAVLLPGGGGTTSFSLGENVVEFTGLSTSDGVLNIEFSGDPNPADQSYGYGAISALSIEGPATSSVPEPSTWALMGAGLVSLVFFARRRATARSLR